MADPDIPFGSRVLAISRGMSGLPEDVFVNSWAFLRATDLPEADPETLVDHLVDFYDGLLRIRPAALVQPDMEFRIYNLEHPVPREPVIITRPVSTAAGVPLPEEVAACLSFYADRNLKRQRGRLYIGPLVNTAAEELDGHVRLHSAFRTELAAAAQQLLASLVGSQWFWGILSPTDALIRLVTNGWVDDALDTVRKRGPRNNLRTLWPVAV